MKDNLLHADIQKFIHKIVLLRHHDVTVKGNIGFLSQLSHQIKAQRHTGAEMPIQYIHMEHRHSCFFQNTYLAFQVTHIQAD